MTKTKLCHTPLCVLVLLILACTATQVSAATIFVSSTQDGFPGTVVAGCSLREAVNAINIQANGNGCTNTGAPFGTNDTIRFNPNVNAIILGLTVALSIQRPMVITGNGQTITNVSGIGTGQTLVRNASSNLTIERLRLRQAGVGVLNQAGARATLFQTGLAGFSGRAVINNGRMQITEVTIENNSGGGIVNGNFAPVNVVGDDPDALCILDNSCEDEGQVEQRPAQLAIDRSVIAGNGPVPCAGISNGGGADQVGLGEAQSFDGTLLLTRSRVVNNNAGNNKGGGICNQSIANITQTEIANNRAQQGGGIALLSPALFPAVINARASTVIKNSTISSNTATIRGGGVLLDAGGGPLTIQSSTITQNSALGNGVQDGGGGMAGAVAPVTFRANVLTDNRSNALGPGLGNCANLQLQGNFNFFPVVNNATCTLTGQNNITTGNAFLAGLALDLSGRRSHVPMAFSPLVDAIPVVAVNLPICSGFDQRERPRPSDGNFTPPIGCDIGAIERP